MTASDAYANLTEKLGFPNSSRLRTILEDLMTPDQARLADALPGNPVEVTEKTGVPAEKVKEELDRLFFKGVVFVRGDFDNREYFRFARSIIQLHDAALATRERDVVKDYSFYERWHDFCLNEMYPTQAQQFKRLEKPQNRVVPAYKSIQDLPDVLAYEDFHELLKVQELIAVVPCSCRYRTTSIGEHCEHTSEEKKWHCIQFGRGAEYAIKRGAGKKLQIDEALELCDKIEEDGLLHMWPNNAAMTGVNTSCQCCRDCCEVYVTADQANLPIGTVWEKSRYQAYVNVDDCTGCQECVDRCYFDAIQMDRIPGSKKLKAVINPDKCFGCGVCVVGCPPEAIKMKVVRSPEHIPEAVS